MCTGGMKNGRVDEITGVPDYNVTIGKVEVNTSFTIERDDSEIIKNSRTWFGNDFDHWKGNLWIINFGNLSAVSQKIELRVEVKVSDRSGNESELEHIFTYDP